MSTATTAVAPLTIQDAQALVETSGVRAGSRRPFESGIAAFHLVAAWVRV